MNLNVGNAVAQVNVLLEPHQTSITDIRQALRLCTHPNIPGETARRILAIITPILYQREYNDWQELDGLRQENGIQKKALAIKKINEQIDGLTTVMKKRVLAAQSVTAGAGASFFFPLLLIVTVPAGMATTAWCIADTEKMIAKWNDAKRFVGDENLAYEEAIRKAKITARDYPNYI